ncbi:MAG: pteridine reductase [Candidatus Thioglobus sp.]|uniref:pteridine reductase n=1 Tax=Candidatus Thioglobus sp. TaxID=2026721 RepID=UPI002604C6BB|nr:pteridine reductase [Candidatus Thioglobus sp.]MDC9726782.1 pteridine reductase [Candidatus Thioglobus sp.]
MKTALVTGGAHRIGQQICRSLHQAGFNLIIHYRTSKSAAKSLADELNQIRPDSAEIVAAELADLTDIEQLCQSVTKLDVLINNASIFYPTPIADITPANYQTMMNTNLMGPLFLSVNLQPQLEASHGCIVNIVDIHADRPLKNHSLYNISKAAIGMMTKTLAKDLSPNIRVNGVAPGSILWPENDAELTQAQKQSMLKKIALNKQGSATDIADTVVFLANSNYITGQIIAVDGGRSLNQ